MPPYRSAEAFKQALEARLGQGRALASLRQRVVFERFLARVSLIFGHAAVVKGGLALELRYAAMVAESDLRWRSLPEVVAAARAFLDPVLLEQRSPSSWSPDRWAWELVDRHG